jgi:UDP-glucuronate decarboxylase
MADLAKMFADAIPGTKANFVSYPDVYPAGEPQRRCPDLAKAAKDLDYASKVDVKTGLTRFVDWAKAQEGYWDRKPA